MAEKIGERFLWAVETLAVKPDDQLLEVGCGHGIAVSLICEKLSDGKIMAIDRSDTMIKVARNRNRDCIASGKAIFKTAALDETDFGSATFNKIFAINVNLFWVQQAPVNELNILKQYLTPDGVLYLFYEPPDANKAKMLADKLTKVLNENGFSIHTVQFNLLNSSSGLYVIAAPPEGKL